MQRRLLTVHGVAQINSWGGTTKNYSVDVDLKKLQAYGITLPNVLSTIGNANSNVGGRTINFGQQSVNVRGVGLLKDTKDIGNIVLSQSNGIPILLKDIANIYVGSQPRMGIAGRDARTTLSAWPLS